MNSSPSMNASANTMGSTRRASCVGGLEIRRRLHFRDAHARALRGGLDHHRQTHFLQRSREVLRPGEHRVRRGRETCADHHALGLELVHGERGGEHARAGIRDAQPFERSLHHPVLAAGTVQRDPGAIEAAAHEFLDRSLARVEALGIHAAALERGKHGVAGEQRDLPLARVAAEQHGDLAEVGVRRGASRAGQRLEPAHAASPTMRTSVVRSTWCSAATVRCTCRISASMSAALALP